MTNGSESAEAKPKPGDPAVEYQAAQSSAEHHDNLAWSATATLWAGSLVLLGFVIDSVKEGRSRVLLTCVCVFGMALTGAVWWIALQLRDVKRQKYERCRSLETTLGFQQHSSLSYPEGRQSFVFGVLMAMLLVVWGVTIGTIWCAK